MWRRTSTSLMRMPKSRRPVERAWEVYNTRSFGVKEGAQNFRSWALGTCVLFTVTGWETYNYWLRLCARGDTCAACEQIFAQKKMRAELLERQSGMS